MEFLGADDQINIREPIDEFLAAALGHAAHETENDVRTIAPNIRRERGHFAQRLLLGHVAHTARIQENDIGSRFGGAERIPFSDELSGDLLGVALIHLATVGLDVNAGHRINGKSTSGQGYCNASKELPNRPFVLASDVTSCLPETDQEQTL